MKINNQKIEKYIKKSEKLDLVQKELSDLVLEAKKNKDIKVSFMAKNEKGQLKKHDAKEGDLWSDIYYSGTDKPTKAKEYLKDKYPKVFEVSEKERRLAGELKEFAAKEFGVDFQRIKLSDILKLIKGVLDGYNSK